MAIEQFAPGDAPRDEFLALARRLYAADQGAIPNDGDYLWEQLNSPVARGGPARAHFIGRVNGRVAARVTAFVNDALIDRDGTRMGALGFFEAENDCALVIDLIARARAWLRSEHGISRIWGPLNFDIWHGYRCMTRGFDAQPFMGEPYNKSYYPALLQCSGGTERFIWNSFESSSTERPMAIQRRGLGGLTQLRAAGYRFVPLNRRDLRCELDKLHGLLNRAFARFPAFTPIAATAFRELTAPLTAALVPGGAWFVHQPDGVPCGFAIAILDLARAARARGERDALSCGIRLPERCAGRRILFQLIGVTPEAAARRPGLGRALVTQVLSQLLPGGYGSYVAPLIGRGNASRGLMGAAAPFSQREYALYEWCS